ncbi:hypothetical protein D3C84_761680 [compost metagenome]
MPQVEAVYVKLQRTRPVRFFEVELLTKLLHFFVDVSRQPFQLDINIILIKLGLVFLNLRLPMILHLLQVRRRVFDELVDFNLKQQLRFLRSILQRTGLGQSLFLLFERLEGSLDFFELLTKVLDIFPQVATLLPQALPRKRRKLQFSV